MDTLDCIKHMQHIMRTLGYNDTLTMRLTIIIQYLHEEVIG